jgi:ankyrin repeat protein
MIIQKYIGGKRKTRRGGGQGFSKPLGTHELIAAAIENDNERIAELLGKPGINVNHVDTDGMTALNWAAWEKNAMGVRLLLDAGANPNIPDNQGNTALLGVALYGRTEMVRQLLAAGANVNHANNFGITPLMHAVRNNQVVATEFLLNAGADILKVNNLGQTAKMIAEAHNKAQVLQLLRRKERAIAAKGITEIDLFAHPLPGNYGVSKHIMKFLGGAVGSQRGLRTRRNRRK